MYVVEVTLACSIVYYKVMCKLRTGPYARHADFVMMAGRAAFPASIRGARRDVPAPQSRQFSARPARQPRMREYSWHRASDAKERKTYIADEPVDPIQHVAIALGRACSRRPEDVANEVYRDVELSTSYA